jgi:hypothetical protein
LALDKEKVHQAPEADDGRDNGSLHNHAVEHIW